MNNSNNMDASDFNETLVGNHNNGSFREFNKSEFSHLLTPTKKQSDILKESEFEIRSVKKEKSKKFQDL